MQGRGAWRPHQAGARGIESSCKIHCSCAVERRRTLLRILNRETTDQKPYIAHREIPLHRSASHRGTWDTKASQMRASRAISMSHDSRHAVVRRRKTSAITETNQGSMQGVARLPSGQCRKTHAEVHRRVSPSGTTSIAASEDSPSSASLTAAG